MALEWLLLSMTSRKPTWRAEKQNYLLNAVEKTTTVCLPQETPARKHHERRMAVVTKSNKFFTAIITRQDLCWKQTYGSQGGVMR